MSVVTLVPYRYMDDYRHYLWDCTRHYLESLGHPIVMGTCSGEWARAQAVNDAARRATDDWDVALIADADTVPDADSIRRAVAWVRDTRGVARPHDQRFMLTPDGTAAFLRRGTSAVEPTPRHVGKTHIGGGLLVVHRDAWDALGGFNESYTGYGREDSEFNIRALVQRRWDRLPGVAWHLWHDRSLCRFAFASQQMYVDLIRKNGAAIEAWAAHKGLAPDAHNVF